MRLQKNLRLIKYPIYERRLSEINTLGRKTGFIIIPKERSLDIDDKIDLQLARLLLKKFKYFLCKAIKKK